MLTSIKEQIVWQTQLHFYFSIMFKANLGPLGPNCQQIQVFLCAFLPNHKVGFIVCLDVIMWTKLIGLTLTSMKVI